MAIPVNAIAKEGAQVFVNFLLSPEGQAKKANIKLWGDPTVLEISKLKDEDAKLFAGISAPRSVTIPGPTLLEPDSSFVKLIEDSWLKKYGQG